MIKQTSTVFMILGLCCSFPAMGGFLDPPEHIGPPLAEHALETRAFQGIPSMTATAGGRLWATWYAGKTAGEDQNNYVVLATSSDGGTNWTEILTVDPDGEGEVRTFDPELWIDPNGSLRLFWAQTVNHDLSVAGVWSLETTQPESENPVWHSPERLTDGVMMCKPLVLSTGEWALPVSTWYTTNSAKMVVSSDTGTNWTVRGACNIPSSVRNCDEHMFVEKTDSNIRLLARTDYGIGESISTDRGYTWPELTPSSIAHATARFFIRRLNSGKLLLVKHGLIDERTSRSLLTAFISTDEGLTWGGGLMLDERTGVSYPDGKESTDGTIRIIYDRNRTTDREILMAEFTEADAASGSDVSERVVLRQIISEYPGESTSDLSPNSDGVALLRSGPGSLSCAGAEVLPFQLRCKLFNDRTYACNELPAALSESPIIRAHVRYLQLPIEGEKTLTCDRAGIVYVLTPSISRNNDSQGESLTSQGFAKVRLPEVMIFDENPTNYCSLYQKACSMGETVTLGKWGIAFFFDE
jgi:hypothetical protein